MGMHNERGREAGNSLKTLETATPARRRLVWRKKGYLAGWQVCAESVASEDFLKGTIATCCHCIVDDGDDPADYEFRIDCAPPVELEEGKDIITGFNPKN